MDVFFPFQVHLFDSSSNAVTNTIIFSQNKDQIQQKEGESIYPQWILMDDSIQTIKMKISKAITDIHNNGVYPNIDSMYLFTRQYIPFNEFDTEKIYQELTKNSSDVLTIKHVQAFLDNFSIDYTVKETDLNNLYQLLEKIHKEISTNAAKGVLRYVPMGFKYGSGTNSYTFPVNPYVYDSNRQIGPRSLIPFDYNLLLRYQPIFQNEIYVCFAKYFDQNTKNIYFPRIGSIPEEMDRRRIEYELMKEPTYQMFYKVFQDSSKEEPIRIRKSIQSFTIVMQNKMRLPLEMVFKNIPTDIFLPAVIFNPGKFKENLLRLYSNRISKTGKRIPILNRSQIVNSLKYTKNNTITYYLPRLEDDIIIGSNTQVPTELTLDIDLFVRLDVTGSLYIHCDNEIPDYKSLDKYLRFRLNPIIQKLNGFLQKSGYELPLYDSISSPNIGIKYYHESWTMKTPPTMTNFSMLQRIPCISNLFDVYEDNGKQIVMKYKRMFNEEESQGQLIREMQQRKYKSQDIINALMLNYHMTNVQAIDRISRFDIEHQARSLFFSPNKEYSFPLEITINPQQMKIDMFKYCRDCGRLPKEEEMEYVVGPKGRIHKKYNKPKTMLQFELPNFSYYLMYQMYVNSIIDILQRPELHESNLVACKPIQTTIVEKEYQEIPQEIPQVNLEEEEEEEEEPQIEQVINEIEEEPIAEIMESIPPIKQEYQEESEEESEEEEEDDSEEEEMFYLKKKGGAPAKKTSKVTKLSILQQREPGMFSFNDERIGTYSRICQKEKQPVILDQEEYNTTINTNPELKTVHYKNPLSSNSQKYWYTCPKYWCSITNSVITEEEFNSGVCRDHVVVNNRYLNPSFLSTDKHPDALCLPCCFEGDVEKKPMHRDRIQSCQESKEEPPVTDKPVEPTPIPNTSIPAPSPILPTPIPTPTVQRTVQKTPAKDDRNILRYVQNPPVTQGRWSLLPRIMELFLNIDYSKVIVKTPLRTNVEPNKPTLFLYGIEHPKRQSFLGLFTEIYRKQKNIQISIQDFRNILISSIHLDLFVELHNGSFVSIFYDQNAKNPISTDEYTNTVLYKSLDMKNTIHISFFEKVIRSYQSFIKYLSDPLTHIDHIYLWELISIATLENMKPLNLVIFEMTQDNKIDVLCPPTTNSLFDPKKETMFVLKRDNFYEPIYQYYDQDGINIIVKHTFQYTDFTPNTSMKRILDIIESSQRQNCNPIMLDQNDETIKTNYDGVKLKQLIEKIEYSIKYQVWNLQGKLIGYYVIKPYTRVESYLPCFPSAPEMSLTKYLPIRFIQDETIHKSYENTWKSIKFILFETGKELFLEPIYKIVDEDNVIGIMTETNQIIPVIPIDLGKIEGTEMDLPTAEMSNPVKADLILSTNKTGDSTRINKIRNILLETQFYQVFRSLIRQLLNTFENLRNKRSILERIKQYENDQENDYEDALKSVAISLYEISQEYVQFDEFTQEQLNIIVENDVYGCYNGTIEGTGQSIYCKGKVLVIPKYSLLVNKETTECGEDGEDCSNKNIFYMRLADELLRYRRIQLFMFQKQTFLNISSGMNEYHLFPNEILLLESSFTEDYFKDMIPFNVSSYIHQTNYDTAVPHEIMTNMNLYEPSFSIKDQEQFVKQIRPEVKSKFEMIECILQTEGGKHPVMGNSRSIWYRSFPKGTEEYFFKDDSPQCTFAVLVNVLKLANLPLKTIQEIKKDLWEGYQNYLKIETNQLKITALLHSQNKGYLLDKTPDLETAIMLEDYFITDLDIWVLMTYWKLPSILFSSGVIKISFVENWLYMNTVNEDITGLYESLVFIRTPRMTERGKYPMYSLIVPTYKINEIGEMGKMIQENMDVQTSRNVFSLDRVLQEMVVLKPQKRGRPAK